MKQMDVSKLVLPFSVFVIAVVIAVGGIFLLSQTSQNPVVEIRDLNAELIKNAVYYHEGCEERIQLNDGVFQQQSDYWCKDYAPPGFLFRIYNDKIALGDLTNDGRADAAVIVTTNYGGSGNIRELAIQVNDQGFPVHLASFNLGDRVIVNDISIQNSRIVLDMVVHDLDDGACCPTQEVRKTFQFDIGRQEFVEL